MEQNTKECALISTPLQTETGAFLTCFPISEKLCWALYNHEQFLCQLHQVLKKMFSMNVLVTDFPLDACHVLLAFISASPLEFIF